MSTYVCILPTISIYVVIQFIHIDFFFPFLFYLFCVYELFQLYIVCDIN